MRKEQKIAPIPDGAIPADPSQQVSNNSYSPPTYYIDKHFKCVDCGSEQIWTAGQQKWYYEVAKGSLYATAVRCLNCRRARTALYEHGDPHPMKHVGALMKRLFVAINPPLVAAGFQIDRKTADSFAKTGLLEFSRSNEIVVVSYQRPDGIPRLVAESVNEQSGYSLLACIDLTPSGDILDQMKSVASAIERYLN